MSLAGEVNRYGIALGVDELQNLEELGVSEIVDVVDVAPRDGLQSDAVMFSSAQKLELIRRIEFAGICRIEVASFVNPLRVPQMADAEDVFAGLQAARSHSDAGATHIGLVLNGRGFDRAVASNAPEINVVVAVTDAFSQSNQSMTTDAAVAGAVEIVQRSRAVGLPVSVTLSVAFGCPFAGEVSTDQVLEIAQRIVTAGPNEIAIADTIGVAVPAAVRQLVGALLSTLPSNVALRAHFHNTRNTGLANALAAVEAGVRTLDASLGGIGGCPFAPKATGNIATEDLVYLLERSGYSTGVDLELLIEASDWLAAELGHPVPSLVAKAGSFPKTR